MPHTSEVSNESARTREYPNPEDLMVYLPWACGQMQCPCVVSMIKVTQSEYVSVNPAAKKSKSKARPVVVSSSCSIDLKRDEPIPSNFSDEVTLKINAFHDTLDRLVELKFDNDSKIPRVVFQILGLIIQFQVHLTTLTISSGIDMYSIHEINKFLPNCNITDLCLDDTYFKEANYYVLLDNCTSIRRISLARCRITDPIVEKIAARLIYPLPASKTLCVLDLSVNKITDLGAKYIANALRTNRCLSYLNLSGNALTDVGGQALFNCLIKFHVTKEELVASRKRLMEYYKQKNELVTRILKGLLFADQRRESKRKSIRSAAATKKVKTIEADSTKDVKSGPDNFDVNQDSAKILYEKARNIAENQMGRIKDPFNRDNLETHDDIVYCLGNNVLCYLNLSFNNLTYLSLKTLLDVVVTQKLRNRKPVGLINVCIEGNYMPICCTELIQINTILYPALPFDKNAAKKQSAFTSKSTPLPRTN